ncbi:hypothetical protein [Flavobacterium orientale]|uniref:Uncharacterized protein n=1 Tax=Flavobacterium orientale TaxID=1756020 RepID=A0A916Y1I0_9FLAO|nr:hypothetical protein [Flavobacterium orientale]GGD27024.1 hypothetical protein GCM10011343_16610 [Flavobacterium orientale]
MLILTFGALQNLVAQETKVGIVKVVKYRDTNDKITESTTDATLAYFNKREHSILITNKKDTTRLKTDALGIFTIPKQYFDYCSITVNPESKYLREEFLFLDGFGKKDSLKLEIYDYHISTTIDSTMAPAFYNKFNTKKAEQDFFAGNKRYLLGNGITYVNDFIEQLKSKSEKFGFKIEYPEKMYGTLAEHRILFRYNERMKELLGIKDW